MNNDQLPRVVVTIGDPAGIGPEVVAKTMAGESDLSSVCRLVIAGPAPIVRDAMAAHAPSSDVQVETVTMPDGWSTPTPGIASTEGGHASVLTIEHAIRMATRGDVDAIATAPINKEAVHMAGYSDIGHQEILGRMTGVTEIATMLMAGRLRAVHLTTHVPFAEAAEHVTREKILARLRLIDRSFRQWGVGQPRIGVAALNPHGGDAGLLGREEPDAIAPAVADATAEGLSVEGPIPADAVYLQAVEGRFDAVLALYHDQGHIAVKMHDFHGSISVNLGLPFVRTSVDHGTAYDIAGQGIAEHRSMAEAIRTAAQLATGRGFSAASVASNEFVREG